MCGALEPSDARALWIARHLMPHEPALRAYIRRLQFSGDLDPDDVVQETYSKFASITSVLEIYNAQAYLYSVARNIVLMHVRRGKNFPVLALDDVSADKLISGEPSPETQASDREQLRLLAAAVSELPERNRRAFQLRTDENLSHREIGHRLGMTDNAVQKSISKSLVKLMARLSRSGPDVVQGAAGWPI